MELKQFLHARRAKTVWLTAFEHGNLIYAVTRKTRAEL